MHIIKAEVETFGKLENKVFEFDRGINVIYGENEAGKSTLASFIKFMLYGFAGKAVSVADNEKKKYTSWEKEKAAGSLTVAANDNIYRIERQQAQRSSRSIVDNSGNVCFEGWDAGDALLGVDEKTFSKTAFIGQLNITAEKMSGMPESIQNILLTADETINAVDAKKKLNNYKNILENTSRKTGEIYDLEKSIILLEEKRINSLANNKELADTEISLWKAKENKKNKENRLNELLIEKEQFEGYLASLKKEEIESLKEKYLHAQLTLLHATENLEYNGFFPDEEYRQQLNTLTSSFIARKEQLNKASEVLDDAKINYESVYNGNEKILKLLQKWEENNIKPDPVQWISEMHGYKQEYKSKKRLALVLLFFIITIPISIYLFSKVKNIKKKIEKLLSLCDSLNEEEFISTLNTYSEVNNNAQQTRLQYDISLNLFESEKNEYESLLESLENHLAKIGERIFSDDDIQEKIKNIQQDIKTKLSYLNEKKDEYNIIKTKYETLTKENDINELSELSARYNGKVPERELGKINLEIHMTEESIKSFAEKEIELDKKVGILNSKHLKPSEIESELNYLKNSLEDRKEKRDALILAMQTIDDACTDIKNEVSPRLTERASHLFSKLTKEKYTSLTVGPNIDLSVLGDQSMLTRDVDYMSAGTIDLAYISLRIALVDYLYGEKPPLIFDDAFVKMDINRLSQMTSLLIELSKEYQIFLFTCHKREAEMLSEKAQVINLV